MAKLDQADHRFHQKWTFATIHRVETSRLDPSSHLVQRKVNKSKHAQSTRHKNAQNVAFCHPGQNLWISPTCIFALHLVVRIRIGLTRDTNFIKNTLSLKHEFQFLCSRQSCLGAWIEYLSVPVKCICVRQQDVFVWRRNVLLFCICNHRLHICAPAVQA